MPFKSSSPESIHCHIESRTILSVGRAVRQGLAWKWLYRWGSVVTPWQSSVSNMAVINISHFIVSHSWEASSFTRQHVLNTKWLSTTPVRWWISTFIRIVRDEENGQLTIRRTRTCSDTSYYQCTFFPMHEYSRHTIKQPTANITVQLILPFFSPGF